MMDFDMNKLPTLIRRWARERDLDNADCYRQLAKISEELGELCEAISKGKGRVIEADAIGDVFIALTVLAMQRGIMIESSILRAYHEIKDRRGVLMDGVFVKEEDIKKPQ